MISHFYTTIIKYIIKGKIALFWTDGQTDKAQKI